MTPEERAYVKELQDALKVIYDAMGNTMVRESAVVRPASMSFTKPSELAERIKYVLQENERLRQGGT